MIDAISRKLTQAIKQNVNDVTIEKEEIIEYGIKIAIYEVIVVSSLIALSLALGIVKYFLIYFCNFGILRVSTGGAHMKSRLVCFITYLLVMLGIVYLSIYLPINNLWIAIPVFFVNIMTVLVYAPGDTSEKPIINKRIRKRLKLVSVVTLVIYFGLALIVWTFDKTVYSIIVLSTIYVTFLLSPTGYKASGCRHSYDT